MMVCAWPTTRVFSRRAAAISVLALVLAWIFDIGPGASVTKTAGDEDQAALGAGERFPFLFL